jgi:hypothetical protein
VFDFANGEKFNTGTMPGSQTLREELVSILMLKVMRQLYFVEVVVYSQVEHQVFSCRMLLKTMAYYIFVDASGAALSSGGYGFTANQMITLFLQPYFANLFFSFNRSKL